MTYTKTTWQSQDVITKDKLNNLESGVETANNSIDSLDTTYAKKEEFTPVKEAVDGLETTYVKKSDYDSKIQSIESRITALEAYHQE